MVSSTTDPAVIVNACLAAAIALGIGTAAVLIFVLGVLLGRIADVSWVRSGLRTVAIPAMTITLIYCFTG